MILALLLLSAACALAETEAPLQALYQPAIAPPVVPEHEPTDDAYFVDAVFIGDSMMEYVEMTGELPTANYVWQIGMSPSSTRHKQFRVRGSDQRLNAFEKVLEYNPQKVYVMLGSNGLDNYAVSYIIKDYEELADNLITYFPDALIYVISAPPMSRKNMTERQIPVSRYPQFAAELKALAERRRFYYIDLYSLVVDEDGYLPREFDAGDGYHLSNRAYSMLIDLVRRTTVAYPEQ